MKKKEPKTFKWEYRFNGEGGWKDIKPFDVPKQKETPVYEILNAEIVEVIRVRVNRGDGEKIPIHNSDEYYTREGKFIGVYRSYNGS